MPTVFAFSPKYQLIDANGDPMVDAKVYTYAAGTTTPQAAYTDHTGDTAADNPIILDARGECDIWLDVTLQYKIVLHDADDNLIWTVDYFGAPSLVVGDLTVSGTLYSDQAVQWLAFDLTGLDNTVVTDTGLFEQENPPCTVLAAAASVKTGSASGGLVFDIHGEGTTILGNKIAIDVNETSSWDAATQPTIATAEFTTPWRMRIDCDDDGDGTATGPCVVMLKVRWKAWPV